jgi:Holliday junction resolvase RusA-like endonuclease
LQAVGEEVIIQFYIDGDPIPKGSTRSFSIARGTGDKRVYTGKTVNMASNSDKLRPWESRVRDMAKQAMASEGLSVTSGPVAVNALFCFRRPASHFRSGKNAHLLKDTAPRKHTNKPDLDKLMRAILDGMANVVYLDDSQVCAHEVDKVGPRKAWLADRNDPSGCHVEVEFL